MFDHFLVSVAIIPPLLVATVCLLARRLSPQVAATTMAWTAAGAAVAVVVNLIAFSAKALAEIPAVADTLGWSAATVEQDTAHVPWSPAVSVVLLALVGFGVTRVHLRHRSLLRRADAGKHPAGSLLEIDSPEPQAFAVPGRRGHVVVSSAMREALSPGQFEALIAHEQAHLRGRHDRLIRLCELSAATHPALRWVTPQVDYLVERAADESAAAQVGSRVAVARAIGTAALATTREAGRGHGLHAAAPGGRVPRRVSSLLKPANWTVPAVTTLVPAGIAVFSLIWTAECVYDLGELLIGASRQP